MAPAAPPADTTIMLPRHAHRPVAAAALIALVWTGSGCSLRSGTVDETGRPRSTRIEFVELWGETILDMGRFPVVPPSEDVYVGDVYALPNAPGSGAPTTDEGLRALATPRWTSLEILPLLEEEYSKRPSWNEESATRPDGDAAAESIYRSGRVPGRHRFENPFLPARSVFFLPELEALSSANEPVFSVR